MSFEKTIEKLGDNVLALERRILELEKAVLEKSHLAASRAEHPSESPPAAPAAKPVVEDDINIENFSGSSQLGWLGIIIAIVCTFIFVHYSFSQGWVTGTGQPLILAAMGLTLFIIGDRIRRKKYPKFGVVLTILSATLLFLAIYWATLVVHSTNSSFLLFAAMGLWAGNLLWSLLRKSALWLNLGICGAGLVAIFVVDDFVTDNTFTFYFLVVVLVSLISSVIKDWSLPNLMATLVTPFFLIIYSRHTNLIPDNQTDALVWMVNLFPTIFILWSGLVALYHNRATTNSEKFSWVVNNALSYIFLFAFWGKFGKPALILIPLAANAILYFVSWHKNNRQTHEFLYLLGAVTSTAIAVTILMPIPSDIMMLCLFAVFLGHYANKEDGWHLKAVSGGMIIWSLIFLFAMRFRFSIQQETPFLNLRFSSFVIAFLCFAYQGIMINNDLKAKDAGPILGQGLLSLGLSVLLAGLGGEITSVFPAAPDQWISQPALLSLTILGGAFAFVVAYTGRVLKLFYVRILSIIFFLMLVAKLLFFDLFKLDLPYLVISLASVALLLGSTSVLLKKKAA